MATTSSIDYKQALQVAGVAIAFGVMEPTDSLSKIGALALGLIAWKGADTAYTYAKKGYDVYQLYTHDVPRLEKLNAYLQGWFEEFKQRECDISDYFVPDNKEVIESIRGSLPQQNTMDLTDDVICYVIPQISIEILKNLPVKDIAQFGSANKCCYLATKASGVWEEQLKKLFPNFKPLNVTESAAVTPELQCKMLYKRFYKPLHWYQNQDERKARDVLFLRGPNGFDGEIDRVWRLEGNSPTYHELHRELKHLVGHDYDGTDASIAPYNSSRGNCLSRITQLTTEINSQDKPNECLAKVKEYLELERHLSFTAQKWDKLLKEAEEKAKLARQLRFWLVNSNFIPPSISIRAIATLAGNLGSV